MSRHNKLRLVCLVQFLAFLLFVPVDCALGCQTKYHKTITEHAVGVLPEKLRQSFDDVLPALLSGVEEPDKNRVVSHKYPIYSLTGEKVSQAEAHIALEEFAKKAEEMIKAGEDKEKIAYVLGQALHFIQDLNLPLHGVSGEPRCHLMILTGIIGYIIPK